jgi:hypothetical protein
MDITQDPKHQQIMYQLEAVNFHLIIENILLVVILILGSVALIHFWN